MCRRSPARGGASATDMMMRERAGFRMAPFGLFDLTGIDASGAVAGTAHPQHFGNPGYCGGSRRGRMAKRWATDAGSAPGGAQPHRDRATGTGPRATPPRAILWIAPTG
ncbi:hypothetical protein AL036_11785 [Salipiger aestuarii]|nr:hypothetical protein AL036_11785 [Salipiger aestuarii]